MPYIAYSTPQKPKVPRAPAVSQYVYGGSPQSLANRTGSAGPSAYAAGSGYMYSGSPASDAARAPYYPTPTPPRTVTVNPAQTAAGTPPGSTGGTSTSPGGGGGQAGFSNPYDVSTDPIVAKIKALGTMKYSDALAGADAAKKQLLTQFGDPGLVGKTAFGDVSSPTYGDPLTAQAAQQNPFSTVATLGLQHQRNQAGIDTGENAANLFYSSHRANTLGDEGQQYLKAQSDAQGAVQDQFSNITGQLLGARQAQDEANLQAQQQARDNAVSYALSQGLTFAGYDPSGQPTFHPPAGAGGAPGLTDASSSGPGYGVNPTAPSAAGAHGGTASLTPSLAGTLGSAAVAQGLAGRGPLVQPDQVNPAAMGFGGGYSPGVPPGQLAGALFGGQPMAHEDLAPILAALTPQQLRQALFGGF